MERMCTLKDYSMTDSVEQNCEDNQSICDLTVKQCWFSYTENYTMDFPTLYH